MGLSLRLYALGGDTYVPKGALDELAHVEPADLDTAAIQAACRFEEFHRYPSLAFPYSFVDRLRRAYVLHHLGAPLTDEAAYRSYVHGTFPEVVRRSHLCNHGDSDGAYVPADFPDPRWIGRYGIGSVPRLRDELRSVAPALGLDAGDPVAAYLASPFDDDDPLGAEKHALAALLEMARLSLDYGTALVFS